METGSKVKLVIDDKTIGNGVIVGEYNVPDRMRNTIRENPGRIVTDERSSWQTQYIKVGRDIVKLDRK